MPLAWKLLSVGSYQVLDRQRHSVALILLLLSSFASHAQAPEYTTGDACLFCHRDAIGTSWLDNAHAWTVRPADAPPAVAPLPPDTTHVIGKDRFRALKQTGYGTLALLAKRGADWQAEVFGTQCVGCHATGVDPATRQYSALGLDCFSCHGHVADDHPQHKGGTLLAKSRKAPAREVMSICGSCHLRGGRSAKTARPYPHAFVPGDELFDDFKVDLRLTEKRRIDDNDAHVYLKTRAVIEGKSSKTCVDCHRIHGPPESKDRKRKLFSEICEY